MRKQRMKEQLLRSLPMKNQEWLKSKFYSMEFQKHQMVKKSLLTFSVMNLTIMKPSIQIQTDLLWKREFSIKDQILLS